MASIATFLSTTPSSPAATLISKPHQPFPPSTSATALFNTRKKSFGHLSFSPRVFAAAGGTKTSPVSSDERVQKVHNADEFDAALRAAKNKLVVVEYATKDSDDSQQIYPFMVQLSRTCGDVEFLLVMGDESEQTRACHGPAAQRPSKLRHANLCGQCP